VGENQKSYYQHLRQVLDHKPVVTLDDGADLVSLLIPTKLHEDVRSHLRQHGRNDDRLIRLARHGEKRGGSKLPVVAVNDAGYKISV